MTRQLIELKHPLYPHPDLIKYHEDHKAQYYVSPGSYDDSYRNWYQLVRADHDISGAPKRPIHREISQIIRLKSYGKEYLLYSETLYGLDHENNVVSFFHTYGQYTKPSFKTTYNYDEKKAYTIRTGQNQVIYFIPYDKKLIDELYEAGPDDKDIELLVNVGSKQYGGRGFYSYEEFRDLPLERLGQLGREGKGMFTASTTQIPVGTMVSEITAASGTNILQQQSQLYKEFQEFQKWKQQAQQQQQQQQLQKQRDK